MISVGIILLAAVFYFIGRYEYAFWLIVLSIISGSLAVGKSVFDPVWYMQKRMEAGLEPGSGIGGLIVTKIIIFIPLVIAAWWFGQLAGYF